MKAELVPENGDAPIPISRDISVLGRREYCDVQIDHPTVSKRHCVLVRTSGLLILRDLASTNGTKVKGQRIRWAALLPGDRVSFGGYKIRVYLGPDDLPSPSETHGRTPEAATGFAAPTPPVMSSQDDQPISDEAMSSAMAGSSSSPADHRADPPVPEEQDAELIIEDDIEDDDRDDQWRKLSSPADNGEFFIELD